MTTSKQIIVFGETMRIFFTYSIIIFLFFVSGCGEEMYPIHDAVVSKDISKIEELLQSGVSVNKTDAKGRTPLYWAALEGSKEVAEYLISKGAKIEKGASWKNYNTPLHIAADKGYKDVVALLIDKGADVSCKNEVKQMPLHFASWRIHPETVEFLLSKGANVEARDNANNTPLHIQYNDNEYISQEVMKDKYKRVVEILIKAGANVNAKNKFGFTPLIGACIIGSKEVVELLIKNGADVNPQSDPYGSPLELAILNKHKEVEEVLRRHGARVRESK